jgi:hypothetical protein
MNQHEKNSGKIAQNSGVSKITGSGLETAK